MMNMLSAAAQVAMVPVQAPTRIVSARLAQLWSRTRQRHMERRMERAVHDIQHQGVMDDFLQAARRRGAAMDSRASFR